MSTTIEITVGYGIGDFVYLKAEEEQRMYMVTGYQINSYGNVLYILSGRTPSNVFAEYIELSEVKTF